jgi:pimeloyl-ACP methyl ester carboxylesterase
MPDEPESGSPDRPGRYDPGDPEAPWTHGEADLGEVTLHYAAAGPVDGDLVVLLHGFPEFWYAWRHQLPALADAGYRVVAPDMRGYNRSDKPAGVASYATDPLVADVVGLVHTLDRESAHVVGHDWGGGVAWEVGSRRPDVVDRLVVLNAPHPTAFRRELSRNPDQLRRSWYVFYFQVPRLPEFGLTWDKGAMVERVLADGAADPAAFTGRELTHFRSAFCRDGVATAAVNYYRAAFRGTLTRVLTGRGDEPGTVPVPTLVCWGTQDDALSPALFEGLDELVPDVRIERFHGASHWVQADEPGAVSRRLLEFFAAGEA